MNEILHIDPSWKRMEGILPRVLSELEHYRENPRFLLILTCSFAELLVGTLLEARCKDGKKINDNARDFPFSVRLTLLYEMGLLHELHFSWLNWLRKLRNDAAHKADFRFTANRMPEWGGPEHKTTDKLFSLCANVLCILWNQNTELYREKLPFDA